MEQAEFDIERSGFVRVNAPGSGAEPVWLTCNSCGKSDQFLLESTRVRCRCGAEYGWAEAPKGQRVGLEGLEFVAWEDGPKQLADLEWDPTRLALLIGAVLVLLSVAGGVGWYLLS